MPKLPKSVTRVLGPASYGIDFGYVPSEISHARKAHLTGPVQMRRMRRAEKITGVPFPRVAKAYKKTAPAGPVSSVGATIAGIPGWIGGEMLGTALGAPALGPAAPFTTGLAAGTAGYALTSSLARKALAPIDRKFFQKQLKRTAKIHSQLEKYRGV